MQVLKAGHDDGVRPVAWSADGRWLATGRARRRGGVDVWDVLTGRVVATLPGSGATFAGDTGELVVWGRAGLVGHHPPDFRPAPLFPEPAGVAAARGRRVVAVVERPGGGELRCWTADTAGWRPAWVAPAPFGRMAFDPTGRWLALANDEWVEVRAAADGQPAVRAVGLTYPDLGGLLDDRRVVLGYSGSLQVYDVAAARPVTALDQPEAWAVRPAVSAGGRWLLAGTRTGAVLASVEPLAVRRQYHFHTRGKPTCVAFAPNGQTAACGTGKGEVVVWDVD